MKWNVAPALSAGIVGGQGEPKEPKERHYPLGRRVELNKTRIISLDEYNLKPSLHFFREH